MSDSQKSSSSSLNKSIKSTPSSLLVMQQPIIYMPISTFESTEASHFDDMNVTNFLEAWENTCQDHGLIEKLMMQHLSLYCKDFISEHIKSLSEYESRNWKQLKEHLQKDYIQQDIKQQYYLRAYLEQYKQFFSKEDLCTYCLQYHAILSQLIVKQELNNYTACLWFLKELLKKKQAKVVKQAGIKTSVSDTFHLNAVLKTTEQMCEEKKSLNVLHDNNNSMKTLQKLINQWWEKTTAINKGAFTMRTRPTIMPEPNIDKLATKFQNLTLSLQAKLDHCEHLIDKVMTTAVHSTSLKLYQLCLSQSYPSRSYSSSMNYEHSVTSIQTNQQETWSRTSEQKSDCNVCWFCTEWGHHQRICSHLLKLIEAKKIHLNKRLCIAWGLQSRDSTFMSLDFLMRQLNFVRLLLKKKERWNKTQADHHEANLIELQCNFNSDLEENDLFSTFEYQVLSANSSDLTAASQKSQNKQSQECSCEILEQKAKITKQWAQEEQNLFTSKTLCSDKWWTSQVVISEARHDELSMNEDSDETMNEDKEGSRSTVRFLESESIEKARNALSVLKIKNVKLVNVLQQMTEQNSTQVVQKMLQTVVSDITVKNILTSGSVTHKLMFKLNKPDIIFKISETEKVNINSL